MKIIAKPNLGTFGVPTVALGVLFVGIQLFQGRDTADSEQYVDTEHFKNPDEWPLFGSASETVPAYALYVVEERMWVVDCYSIGAVFVTTDSTHRFRRDDGSILSHNAFCDLYL